MTEEKNIGLVLSGGGTRGIAHVGAWRGLTELGFQPKVIVGCSMGAIIGTMIAAGKTAQEMETFVLEQRVMTLFQWPITKLGLSKLTKFEQRLLTFLGIKTFEELTIPLIINATNLTTGEPIIYTTGQLWSALRATISIPGLFAPIRRHDDIIVDGGILYEHPFSLLPLNVDKFLMVNCSPREHIKKHNVSAVDILRASLNVMQNTITELRLANVPTENYRLIEPRVQGRNIFENEKQFQSLIDLGAEAVKTDNESLRQFIHQ